MSTVLAIDTSTDVVVGLARDGRALGERDNGDPRRHVEDLTPTVEQLLHSAGLGVDELDLIVVGLGPGPFTGLRVGIATARVLAFSLSVPLRGVCGLDAIAADWCASSRPPSEEFAVVSDARRREVYWARYAADGTRLAGPSVDAPSLLPDLPLAGPGVSLCPDRRVGVGAPTRLSGAVLATVGPSLPEFDGEPIYLRRPDAVVPAGRKSVLPRLLNRPSRW